MKNTIEYIINPFISIKANIVARTENTTANDRESLQASLNLADSNRSVVKDVLGLKKLTITNITIECTNEKIDSNVDDFYLKESETLYFITTSLYGSVV